MHCAPTRLRTDPTEAVPLTRSCSLQAGTPAAAVPLLSAAYEALTQVRQGRLLLQVGQLVLSTCRSVEPASMGLYWACYGRLLKLAFPPTPCRWTWVLTMRRAWAA